MKKRKRHQFQKVFSLFLALFMGMMTLSPAFSVSAALIADDASKWKTNLTEIQPVGNTELTYTDDGLLVTGGGGDQIAFSTTKASGDFVYESDVTYTGGRVANLIFGAPNNNSANDSYVLKLDRTNQKETKIFHYGGSWESFRNDNEIVLNKTSYHIKVAVTGGSFQAYVDDILIAEAALPAQNQDGYLGMAAMESSAVVFQNTYKNSEHPAFVLGGLSGDAAVTAADAVTVNKTGGDNLVLSSTSAAAFTLETDITVASDAVGGVFFGSPEDPNHKSWYGVQIRRKNWDSIPTGNQLRIYSDVHGVDKMVDYDAQTAAQLLADDTCHMKLEVTQEGRAIVTLSHGDTVMEPVEVMLNDYSGGYIGLMSYTSQAEFQNVTFTDNTPAGPVFILGELSGSHTVTGADAAVVDHIAGNNHAVSKTSARNFTLEADITYNQGEDAGFIFGCPNSVMGSSDSGWIGIKLSKNGGYETGYMLRLFREGYADLDVRKAGPAPSNGKFHLKVVVEGDSIKAYVGDQLVIDQPYSNYPVGYVGLSTYNCQATYENVKFEVSQKLFTNLTGIAGVTGTWENRAGGYGGDNSAGSSDVIALFAEEASPDMQWIFEGDMHLENSKANGGLVFGRTETVWYGANIDRYWPYPNGNAALHRAVSNPQSSVKSLTSAQLTQKDFHIRVEYDGEGGFRYYLDGSLAASFTDKNFAGGRLGLSALGADVTFNNIYYYEKMPGQTFKLTGLALEGASFAEPFDPKDQDRYVQATAEAGLDMVRIIPTADEGTKILIGGKEVQSGEAVDLKLKESGYGYSTAEIRTSSEDGYFASSFTLAVLKPAPDLDTLYSLPNRPQFHYTAPYGFINDPNGMMYNAATGEYQFFYQAYPYTLDGGPKHWGHATTSDLVRFNEKKTALYPDNNGDMWSGSGIIDYTNTAGLYDDSTPPEARMVLVYYAWRGDGTSAGLAYTEDGGDTWIKAKDGEQLNFIGGQPGHIDPKVLWFEQEQIWVMICASGRLYTSTDLWNWTYNSYDVGWECPDIYEIKVEGTEETKWVRTVGGSFYLIGDLVKDENGIIKFQAESDPLLYNGDSLDLNGSIKIDGWIAGSAGVVYATQHYKDAPNGRIVAVSWIRENYSKKLDPTGTWTGSMTVAMEQKLYQKDDGTYILYSYPVEETKSLRGDLLYSGKDIKVTPESGNILEGKTAVLADIDGSFTLDENVTEFGFNLRTGNDGGSITLKYDAQNQMLTSDFSHSKDSYYTGIRTMKMELPADRTISLRVLLDNIIVESFGNDGEAAISSVFSRDASFDGMEFYTTGGNVTVNSLDIYAMNSAWKESAPQPVPTTLTDLTLNSGLLEPNFSADVTEYTAKVGNNVDSIKVMPTYTGDNAVTVGGNEVASGTYSGDIALAVGENTITVVAGEKTYTITVTREDKEEPPVPVKPVLDGLELSSGTLNPAFDRDVNRYTSVVAHSVDKVQVKVLYTGEIAVTVNGKAVENGRFSDDIALQEGENIITISLSLDGEVNSYQIIVNREHAGNTDKPPVTTKPGKPSIPGGSNSGWQWPSGSGAAAGKENPHSGDSTRLPAVLMVLAGAAGTIALLSRKRKK